MNRWSIPGFVAMPFLLIAAACSDDSADESDETPTPVGLGFVCIHYAMPTELRDAITSAVEASRAHLLPRCPGGAETDVPAVASPGFDPARPEATAAELGRIVHSTDGGFEPVHVAVLRAWPTDPAAAGIATLLPVAPSLYYSQGGSCIAVQFEAYVSPDMNRDALLSRVEAAARLTAVP